MGSGSGVDFLTRFGLVIPIFGGVSGKFWFITVTTRQITEIFACFQKAEPKKTAAKTGKTSSSRNHKVYPGREHALGKRLAHTQVRPFSRQNFTFSGQWLHHIVGLCYKSSGWSESVDGLRPTVILRLFPVYLHIQCLFLVFAFFHLHLLFLCSFFNLVSCSNDTNFTLKAHATMLKFILMPVGCRNNIQRWVHLFKPLVFPRILNFQPCYYSQNVALDLLYNVH